MVAGSCALHRNIQVKFNENLSKGSGDMNLTRKCYGLKD